MKNSKPITTSTLSTPRKSLRLCLGRVRRNTAPPSASARSAVYTPAKPILAGSRRPSKGTNMNYSEGMCLTVNGGLDFIKHTSAIIPRRDLLATDRDFSRIASVPEKWTSNRGQAVVQIPTRIRSGGGNSRSLTMRASSDARGGIRRIRTVALAGSPGSSQSLANSGCAPRPEYSVRVIESGPRRSTT